MSDYDYIIFNDTKDLGEITFEIGECHLSTYYLDKTIKYFEEEPLSLEDAKKLTDVLNKPCFVLYVVSKDGCDGLFSESEPFEPYTRDFLMAKHFESKEKAEHFVKYSKYKITLLGDEDNKTITKNFFNMHDLRKDEYKVLEYKPEGEYKVYKKVE